MDIYVTEAGKKGRDVSVVWVRVTRVWTILFFPHQSPKAWSIVWRNKGKGNWLLYMSQIATIHFSLPCWSSCPSWTYWNIRRSRLVTFFTEAVEETRESFWVDDHNLSSETWTFSFSLRTSTLYCLWLMLPLFFLFYCYSLNCSVAHAPFLCLLASYPSFCQFFFFFSRPSVSYSPLAFLPKLLHLKIL